MVILKHMYTLSPCALTTTNYLYSTETYSYTTESKELYDSSATISDEDLRAQHKHYVAVIVATQCLEYMLAQRCMPFTMTAYITAPLCESVFELLNTPQIHAFKTQQLVHRVTCVEEYTLSSLCNGTTPQFTRFEHMEPTHILQSLSQCLQDDVDTCSKQTHTSQLKTCLQNIRLLKQDYVELVESYFENSLSFYRTVSCHTVISASYMSLMLHMLTHYVNTYRIKQLLMHKACGINMRVIHEEQCVNFVQLRRKLIDDYAHVMYRSQKLFMYINERNLTHYLYDTDTCITYTHTCFLTLWYAGIALLTPNTIHNKDDAEAKQATQLAISQTLIASQTELLTNVTELLTKHVNMLVYKILNTHDDIVTLMLAHINLIRLNLIHTISVKNIHKVMQLNTSQQQCVDNVYTGWLQLLSSVDR